MAVLKEMTSGPTPAAAISSISSSASFHWFFLASAAITVLYDTWGMRGQGRDRKG